MNGKYIMQIFILYLLSISIQLDEWDTFIYIILAMHRVYEDFSRHLRILCDNQIPFCFNVKRKFRAKNMLDDKFSWDEAS